MGGDHVGDRECDGDQRPLPESDLAGPWGDRCLSLPFLAMCMGPAAVDKGYPKVCLAAQEQGWRRVRGKAGCSHRQSRMLTASELLFLLLLELQGGIGNTDEGEKLELSCWSFQGGILSKLPSSVDTMLQIPGSRGTLSLHRLILCPENSPMNQRWKKKKNSAKRIQKCVLKYIYFNCHLVMILAYRVQGDIQYS